jgi:hypothetical protein
MRMRSKDERTVGFIVVAMIGVAVYSETRAAQSVALGWDPSPDPSAVGYAVHYGTDSGIYTSRVDAGTNTTIIIAGLLEGLTYYFVATAYDGRGNESIPSGELVFTVPLAGAVYPTLGQLSIGSTLLQTGQTGSVAMVLSSSAGLTDLDVILDVPLGRLTNLAFQALAPEIDPLLATVTPQSATAWLLHLAAASGQILVGSNQVAQLGFTAIAGQPSALVPLTLLPFSATTADGVLLTNRPVNPGRIVVIGRESLLEASLDSSGKPGLTLYGKPSSSYIVEFTTNLCSPVDWVPLPSTFNPAALAIPVPLLSPAPDQIFYRAVESPAN